MILERAQNAAGYLAFKSSATLNREDIAPHSESVLLQQFREEVLKRLPDVKTVISLRQNLIVGSTKQETQEGRFFHDAQKLQSIAHLDPPETLGLLKMQCSLVD